MTRRLVVVGNGMVGHRLVETLRLRDRANSWRITILADETRPAYNRVALSSYLAPQAADLTLAGPQPDPMVDLRLGRTAISVNRATREVVTADGQSTGYDALVLATGSEPFVPPIPGAQRPHCFVFRTLDDLDAIRAAARTARRGIVIGGGLLGLEAANALRLLGLSVVVIERAHLMAAQLDQVGGTILARQVTEIGLTCHCAVGIAAINGDTPDGPVETVTLTDGSTLDADLVVFAAGVRPRDQLASTAGLEKADRGGILVDRQCRTSDPRIWAVGECAAVEGRCYGLVSPGYRMADIVVGQLLGMATSDFTEPDQATRLKLLGVDVATFGDSRAEHPGTLELAGSRASGSYVKLLLDGQSQTVRGGMLVGDVTAFAALHPLLGRRLTPSARRQLRL